MTAADDDGAGLPRCRVVVSRVELVAHLIVLDDDGQVVNEVATSPIVVVGRDWPTYSGAPFEAVIAPIVSKIAAEESA